jgi:hypothetical protein
VWHGQVTGKDLCGRYKGHTDFVKAVVCTRISGKDVS